MAEITDTERIDALETFVQREEGLVIHNGRKLSRHYPGLGFWDGLRDLRKALDGLVEGERKKELPDQQPTPAYTPDQQRVAQYLHELTKGQIGAGDDPIGFLIASHAALSKKASEAVELFRIQLGRNISDPAITGLLRQLCEKHGYGNVMYTVSELYREKDPYGAFTVGHCVGPIEKFLK
jgi:hypothetical protein